MTIEFELGNNGQAKCTRCREVMPKDIKRLSFDYRDGHFSKTLRICEACVLELSKGCNKKNIDKFRQTSVLKKL